MSLIMEKILKRFKGLFKRITKEEGFTLIEIMIVITIMGILIGLLISTNPFKKIDIAKQTGVRIKLKELVGQVLVYSQIHGTPPSTEEGLNALVAEKIIKQNDTIDAWGNPYQYRYPGESDPSEPEIWSYGADGQEGGTGSNADVKSWDSENK